jgi:hypothetical protein
LDPRLKRLQQEITAATANLSSSQLMWHTPGKWSCSEILEHLYLTYTGTTKGFGRVVEAGKPMAGIPTWKQRAQALVVVRLRYMPSGRESPAVARPRGIPPEKIVAEIATVLGGMDEVMSRCAAKFGARTKVLDHPILGPFSVRQWRTFHLVHGLHHLKQIRGLRGQMSAAEGKA